MTLKFGNDIILYALILLYTGIMNMNCEKLLEIMHTTEKLKDTMRHCFTSSGRRESVAEHSWRLALLAYFVTDEFEGIDTEKLLKMCIIHDLGEIFTGDVPVFNKTKSNEETEENLLFEWVGTLDEPFREEMLRLYKEMDELKTTEARVYKALDGIEALIQHNESDINTWLELEYNLQLTYADDKVAFSDYLKELREVVRQESIRKIEKERASETEDSDKLN